MSDVLVLGGGICGLATAMLLARDGHEVTVLEGDPEGPPVSIDEALETWDRSGVTQFRLAHFVHVRFREIVQQELPEILETLTELGALRYNLPEHWKPATLEDRSPRPGDDRYWTLTARRPVLELAFAQRAEDEPGVKIVRGVQVAGFLTGAEDLKGVPHVVGVRTRKGDELRADLVIDAMGRRSETPQFLRDVGGRPPDEEQADCGYTYYGRYYRSKDGSVPEVKASLLANIGTISILTLPADNGTWMPALVTSSGDMPLKQLRFEEKYEKVIRSIPAFAHWTDGEPIGPFLAMGGILDRCRRFVVDDTPVVTGLLPVADAWACTNPSFGRGISLGVMQAQRLRDVVRDASDGPATLAREYDSLTERELKPWYDAQIQMDRQRVAEIDALREGREPPGADDPAAQMTKAFFTAFNYDPDVYRGFIEIMSCLSTPEEVLSRPGLFEKLLAAAADREPPTPEGPTREELLELVS